jgi:hypothetical protein
MDIDYGPSRAIQELHVDSCEACGKKHRLTIEYTPLFVTMEWPNPEPTSESVEYRCPVNGKSASSMATFQGPVEDLEVMKVENA